MIAPDPALEVGFEEGGDEAHIGSDRVRTRRFYNAASSV